MPYDTVRQAIAFWSSLLRTAPTPTVAAQVITSDWIQVSLYPLVSGATSIPVYHDRKRVRAACFTDQASAANGLAVQQSNDETATKTVHYQTQATVGANGLGTAIDDPILCKFIRVRYTTGGTPPTTFSLRAEICDQ